MKEEEVGCAVVGLKQRSGRSRVIFNSEISKLIWLEERRENSYCPDVVTTEINEQLDFERHSKTIIFEHSLALSSQMVVAA